MANSYETAKNMFSGGLDTNTVKSLLPPSKYFDAHNVNVAGTSNFFALENIQGTSNIKDILPAANIEVLAVYASKYKIGNVTDIPCLTIFTGRNEASANFKIWCYDTQSNTLYEVYEQPVDQATYFTSDRVIDGILYPEGGIDILYFTDDYHEIRKLRCEIPLPYSPNFATDVNLKLTRHGGNGHIEMTDVAVGGSLLSGSYQIAYQLINPASNQFSKFSLLTNPIQVYLSDEDALSIGRSGVGLISNRKIVMNIYPSQEELAFYTHFRLAVLENVMPSGVVVENIQLTRMEEIGTYLTGDVLMNVEYKANSRLDSVNITELVVDLLALDHVKTLAIRQNRLLAGNITYKALEYDNDSPVIGGGSILKQSSATNGNICIDPVFTSRYRGHFRNEVYRYAISYFDENGNFSFPSILDMSSITDNQSSTSGHKDMKFPARHTVTSTTYSLFANGRSMQSLGLQLTNIDNHPSWARGFIILRAKRVKDILFQTPVVPMMSTYAVGPLEEYPIFVNELSGTGSHAVDVPDAKPMGPFTTYLPRNYFWPRATETRFFSTPGGAIGSSQEKRYTGEAYLAVNDDFNTAMIFPPEFMYENKPFTFSPTYSLRRVDMALMKMKLTNYSNISIGTTTLGRNIKTSVSGTFYALNDSVYYYDSTHNKASMSNADMSITAYQEFANFAEGMPVGGSNCFNYDKLETPGIFWGVKGNTNKCAVIKTPVFKNEVNSDSARAFAAGSQVAKDFTARDVFTTDQDNYIQTIEICNVTANLDDARYGATSTPHEFIYTGSIVTFDTSELPTVQAKGSLPKTVDVWGGDCYVGTALFKLTDTVYGVSSSEKFEGSAGLNLLDATRNWEKSFNDLETANESAMSIPVPYKNAAQYIHVVLENEYNQAIMDNELVVIVGNQAQPAGVSAIPIVGLGTAQEGACRVPLSYQVNQNHKKQNDDKIFRLKDPFITTTTHFGSRVIFSDQKVYQTSVNGFDIFRVLDVKDLEETYGNIHALALLNNDLYSLQDKAVTYFGIGERTLETTDALTLAVSTGEFIGNVTLISNKRGTQHLKSLVNTGDSLYFLDNLNQTINRLAGRQVEVISETALASELRTSLSTLKAENRVIASYDPIKKQIWMAYNDTNPFCYIFDEARGIWISKYDFTGFKAATYADQKFYIVGADAAEQLSINTMYTGDRTYLLGRPVVPSVSYSVNEQLEVGKVFDAILLASSNRLSTLDLIVEREIELGPQIVSGIQLDVTTRGEGNYRAKVLRDAGDDRLRGLAAYGTLKWQSGEAALPQAVVTSIITKYRPSENRY